MKRFSLSFLLTLLMSMMGSNVFAYDFAVENADGVTIYYNYANETELAVTYLSPTENYSAYSGTVAIPEKVTFMNRTRKVTSIGPSAFEQCGSLTSVIIPNSVTSINSQAFRQCRKLRSITIPNSVTMIGNTAFSGCESLTSITIPNGITSIGESTFSSCSGLTSITIPYGVTSIGNGAFNSCSGLTSITIPNSVKSIGDGTFGRCRKLSSITIPNSVTTIGNTAFSECTSLTSIQVKDGNPVYDSRGNCNAIILTENNKLIIGCKNTKIPNSVTSIGSYAFYGCSGLTSITIPNNVTSIGYFAFECENLATVVSLIKNPVAIDFFAFSNNAFLSATLYVPVGTISKYKSTEGWKRFVFIEEGTDGGDTPDTPEPEKCEKPTINYYKGKLSFNCATDGATCQYSITDTDIKTGSGSELQLGVTYQISVYATKQGCYNSDEATATLCWIDIDPKMEGIENDVANVKAMPVLIQGDDGVLQISGAPEGTAINVYEIGGQLVGSAKASSDTTVIPTTLSQGSIAIVKIGEKAVKVLMK